MIVMPSQKTLVELLKEVCGEAIAIGSCNWDSYLAGNCWPELEDSPRYKELCECLQSIEETLN